MQRWAKMTEFATEDKVGMVSLASTCCLSATAHFRRKVLGEGKKPERVGYVQQRIWQDPGFDSTVVVTEE